MRDTMALLWHNESGSAARDSAILVALCTVAYVLWLNQLGGPGALRETIWGLKTLALGIAKSVP